MSNREALIIITGILLIDDLPFPEQEILVISEDMNTFLASCLTDAHGQFTFVLPKENSPSRAILLVKVKSNVVTLSQELIEIPQANPIKINIETKQHFLRLEGIIESAEGWPEYINIFLDPVEINDIPGELERFFKQTGSDTFESHFLEVPVSERTFLFRVKAGKYKVGGEYIDSDRPNIVTPNFDNYIVDTVILDSPTSQLNGDPYGGFLLEVNVDCRVILSLRVVEDEELLR